VTVLEDVEDITVEIGITIDVHVREVLDLDLVTARVLALKLLGLEGDIGLNWAAGKLGLVVKARAHVGSESPVSYERRNKEDEAEKHLGLPATTKGAANEPWHDSEESEENIVVEVQVTRTFSRKRSILDGRILQ
jgi:hypothetical protein